MRVDWHASFTSVGLLDQCSCLFKSSLVQESVPSRSCSFRAGACLKFRSSRLSPATVALQHNGGLGGACILALALLAPGKGEHVNDVSDPAMQRNARQQKQPVQ